MTPSYEMKYRVRSVPCLVMAALLATMSPTMGGKSYSSGSRSYSSSSSRSSGSSSHSSSSSSRSSSSSSHSSGSGGGSRSSSSSGSSKSSSSSGSSKSSSSSGSSKSFSSGSGKSYTSRPSSSESKSRNYSSGKSYSSGNGTSSQPKSSPPATAPKPGQPAPSSFTFDTAAARAKKEEASKTEYNKYKESQSPRPSTGTDGSRSVAGDSSRPPIPSTSSSRRTVYVPDYETVSTRPIRVETIFRPYYSRPVVVYRDPFNSFFWWWLLDRSIDDRAWWAYHHRYDMDPGRYSALMAHDQQLEARIAELEARQLPRDTTYVPAGLDRDLMYSDNYVANSYSHRRTSSGTISFWLLAVPTAIAVCWFFIWLIWFKRWQTAT